MQLAATPSKKSLEGQEWGHLCGYRRRRTTATAIIDLDSWRTATPEQAPLPSPGGDVLDDQGFVVCGRTRGACGRREDQAGCAGVGYHLALSDRRDCTDRFLALTLVRLGPRYQFERQSNESHGFELAGDRRYRDGDV